MKIPTNIRAANIKQAAQEKLEEREIWHKLVVKVIIWREGSSKDGKLREAEKITSKEWEIYCKRMISMSVTYGKEKAALILKETCQAIQKNGGFENPSSIVKS